MPKYAQYDDESDADFAARQAGIAADQRRQRKEYERRKAARIAKILENPFVTSEEAEKLAEEGLKKEHYAEREGEDYSQEEEMAANSARSREKYLQRHSGRYSEAPREELESEPPNTYPDAGLNPLLEYLIRSGKGRKPVKQKWNAVKSERTYQ